MNKHAYIILAHNEPKLLHILIGLLDDSRNELFVHIDRKADISMFEDLRADKAVLHMLPRMNVAWGGVSLMRLELAALGIARSIGGFSRYHIISGVDLPIKTQDYIHDFFDSKYPNCEFVGFSQVDLNQPEWRAQWEYPYCFADYAHDNCLCRRKIYSFLRKVIWKWCKIIGHRQTFMGELKKGSEWVSITQSFVDWLLARRESIEREFKHVFCSDEKFMQTAIWNSPFRDKLFDIKDEMRGSVREIDWIRGFPYIWSRYSDLKILQHSERIFARKFSWEYSDIVRGVVNMLS